MSDRPAPFPAEIRALLAGAFEAAVKAALPDNALPPLLPDPPAGRTLVVGAGKAAAQMAAAVEGAWAGDLSGLVITRYGHGEGVSLDRIELAEAAHPVPDAAGLRATRRIMEMAAALGPDDLCLVLISGGGSALLCQPLAGMDLAGKQEVTQALLRSGATIHEMNAVRRRLSAVKGGRLAALAAPARVVTLYISDVPGDDAATVASGPSVQAPRDDDAEAILDRYGIEPSEAVRRALASAASPPPAEVGGEARLVAAPWQSLEAAAGWLGSRGWATVILSDRIEGEAREAGEVVAAIAASSGDRGAPFRPPVAILSGGETTVTVRGDGRGGRNAEFALGAALALRGREDVWGIAADTDGIDGVESNAGAVFDGETALRMRAAGVDPEARLRNNDAFAAFAAVDQLHVTGPTGTNVNDFRLLLVGQPG